ncbi:MAG: EamA family transporter [Eubacteriales bacterium]|nr:EamA family transporter [Eubacteriales bacterium]
MNEMVLYSGIFLMGVVISSFAQIALKKTADKPHDSFIRQYMNFPVIAAYTVFFLATLLSILAYKVIPLSMGPVLESTQYLFIALLSWIFLKEHISKRKIFGIGIVIFGILLYSFW